MTTTALCFIADASGGLGTRLVTNILEECKNLHVPIVREPTWLAQFAVLVDESLIPRATLEQCLFGLIRLESHSYTEKTVCVTLPVDVCLERMLPEEEYRRSFPSAIRHTTPLDRSLTKQIPPLADALRELPLQFADATECWMTSVNAMLKLKENEKTNQYLPFVCRLSLLLTQGTPEERHLALVNLLQFMTGSRSRPLPDGAVNEAEAVVSKYYSSDPPKLAIHLHRAVEDCVFRHKSILLGDKTLMDTVLPSKEWSLKAAKKVSGCSCCAPDDDDEDDEGLDNGENKDAASSDPLVSQDLNDISTSVSKKSNYVDGKTKFAFDPSKFS
ncbi:hypothetical protein MHU86_4722 [Fragilaria crotonensis]|nr:hypothetical protein MHU86_4722 [Fragilaria crotonensis]